MPQAGKQLPGWKTRVKHSNSTIFEASDATPRPQMPHVKTRVYLLKTLHPKQHGFPQPGGLPTVLDYETYRNQVSLLGQLSEGRPRQYRCATGKNIGRNATKRRYSHS